MRKKYLMVVAILSLVTWRVVREAQNADNRNMMVSDTWNKSA